jgi:hypothetical protein
MWRVSVALSREAVLFDGNVGQRMEDHNRVPSHGSWSSGGSLGFITLLVEERLEA